MPVSPEIAENNRVQRERLRKLVASLDEAGLRTRLPNGWTVASTLGHLAFWDRQRLCLLQRWAAGDFRSGAYDSDVFNDAVAPLLEMIPPAQIAAAVAMERLERGLSLIEELEASGELDGYHLLPAAKADVLRRMGRNPEAAAAYERALSLVTQLAERRYLQRRLDDVRQADGG